MSRACKVLMGKTLEYKGQDLIPDHKLHGESLAMIIGVCFVAERDAGKDAANQVLTKLIATAVQYRMLDLDYAPLYCHGQIFGEMIDTRNEVLVSRLGMGIGEALKCGKLGTDIHALCMKALRTALDGYQLSGWYWYGRDGGE